MAGTSVEAATVHRRVSDSSRQLSLNSNPEEAGEVGSEFSSPSVFGKDICNICNAKLGKRHLNPRHHCRVCMRCVCATCSPNLVQLQGADKQRVCLECMSQVEKQPEVIGRILTIGERVSALAGSAGSPPASPRQASTLDEALTFVETQIGSAERGHSRVVAASAGQASKLEAEVRVARGTILRFTQRLHALSRTRNPPEMEKCSIGEALALCEAALNSVEASQGGRSSHCVCCGPERYGPSTTSTMDEVARMREGARTPLYCDSTVEQHTSSRWGARWGLRCSKRTKRFSIALAFLAALTLIVLGAVHFMIPSAAQKLIDGASITLVNATMSNPTPTTVRMTSYVVLNNAGPLPATIKKFKASLGSEGNVFGWCMFPEVTTVAGGETHMTLDAEMHVTDNAAFTAATVKILQGQSGVWDISGPMEVHTLGMKLDLQMNKKLQLPATLLKRVQAANIDTTGSTENQLFATSDVSFFSSSVLEMHNFGPLTFSLHPTNPDGSIVADVEMGKVSMENFQVFRDVNDVFGSKITLTKTPESEKYLSEFIGTWVSGKPQIVVIRGPVESQSPFLNNITTQQVEIVGLSEGVMKSGYISGARSLHGHVPETGKQCSIFGAKDCLRGSVIMVGNPLHHEMTLRDMSFDVFMPEELSYDVTIHEAIIPRKVSCDKGKRFAHMFTAPGIWSYINASRQDADVNIPAAQGKNQALSSYFMGGKPQEGQGGGEPCFYLKDVDPEDCCFTTIMPAAACRAVSQAKSYIAVELTGTALLKLGDFELPVTVAQRDVPISFAEDIPKFQVGPIWLNCEDFTFF